MLFALSLLTTQTMHKCLVYPGCMQHSRKLVMTLHSAAPRRVLYEVLPSYDAALSSWILAEEARVRGNMRHGSAAAGIYTEEQ